MVPQAEEMALSANCPPAVFIEFRMDAHKVLSFSPDRGALLTREAVLRKVGFEVFSTSTENQARFEIETAKCGVLLICFRVSPLVAKELGSAETALMGRSFLS